MLHPNEILMLSVRGKKKADFLDKWAGIQMLPTGFTVKKETIKNEMGKNLKELAIDCGAFCTVELCC